MKRLTTLDILVYRFFYWWWTPIFKNHPRMCIEFATHMLEWVERHDGLVAADEEQLNRLSELLKDVKLND